jgi:hypothetical protein
VHLPPPSSPPYVISAMPKRFTYNWVVWAVVPQVDKILFRKPVDIGDLLRLKSRVIYSDVDVEHGSRGPMVVVEVACHVVRPER